LCPRGIGILAAVPSDNVVANAPYGAAMALQHVGQKGGSIVLFLAKRRRFYESCKDIYGVGKGGVHSV